MTTFAERFLFVAPPLFELFFFQNCFIFMSSSTARALGSYSHSKGFGAELLSDSLVMVLWGGSVLGRQKVLWKVPT